MYARVETITPEIAEAYLRKNKKNRHLRKNAVSNYARDMKNGKWQLNPQGISFYQNGDLADGQHRLYAVIKAGVPVDFFVIYDVPDESHILDYGMKRRVTDILNFSGIDVSNEVVALARFLFRCAGKAEPTIQILHDFIEKHDEMLVLAIYCSSHGSSTKNTIARKASCTAAAFCALYCGMDSEWVDNFFRCVNSGRYDESKNQGASIVLRNFLIDDYTGMTDENRREAFYTACFAIKDFCTETPRKFKYSFKGKKTIPFWDYTKAKALCEYIRSY